MVKNPRYQPAVAAALGLGAQYGVLLPFQRHHEAEADRIGLVLMAKAGYDPEAAVGLWERMEARVGSGPVEFLSTHPNPGTRIARIKEHLPEAQRYFAASRPAKATSVARVDLTMPTPDLGTAGATPSGLKPSQTPSLVASLTVPEPLPQSLSPRRPPELRPGFWTQMVTAGSSRPSTFRLERLVPCATGECYLFVADSGLGNVLTKELALAEIRNPDGSVATYSPPLKQYEWPLRVGARWNHMIVIQRSNGIIHRTFVQGQVIASEMVKTPAGEFSTFRLRLGLGGAPVTEWWYAPEIGAPVRRRALDEGPGASLAELVGYGH